MSDSTHAHFREREREREIHELTNLSQTLFLSLLHFCFVFHPHNTALGKVKKKWLWIYDWELELLHCGLDHPQCSSGFHWWLACHHCICSGLDLASFVLKLWLWASHDSVVCLFLAQTVILWMLWFGVQLVSGEGKYFFIYFKIPFLFLVVLI